MTGAGGSDLTDAADAVEIAASVVASGAGRLARLSAQDGRISTARLDDHQVMAYDLAHAASAVAGCRVMLGYAEHGSSESLLARAYIADAVWDLGTRVACREDEWGVGPDALVGAAPFVRAHRAPTFLEQVADGLGAPGAGGAHLPSDFELVSETFRRFAQDRIRPVAEHVHRTNGDIPEDLIAGLAELGVFGLSVPEEYGGFAAGGPDDYLAMVVATEELSAGSLGIGGSLITRPEILTRALLRGGTEDQKRHWLPRIATGELMVGVAVTEPDHGSDVAGLRVSATAGSEGYVVNGTKTWATFAGRADLLMLLARTDPDLGKGHRGLSLFVVEKPARPGHAFELSQPSGGRLTGRAIDTIGYRGMHSFELGFQDWVVPEANLIGRASGLGQGFYLQMEGFENGRLQTAARAVGVMQAAFDAASDYAASRMVFGRSVASYQLTKAKLARMAATIQAGRQFAYDVARRMARGEGALEASMVKAYVCRSAEWVTREAMQLHGGMGYAEEYPVSRYFVDARVLSIFEGADETLCLRVIARRLAEQALERIAA
jgi:(2S)-methylsuccinyl-CoA dehydrogenase